MSKVWHIVLFKTAPDVTPERVQRIRGMFEVCEGEVDGLDWVRTGSNTSASDFAKGWDEAVVMQFADASARDAYLPHPLHQAVSAEVRGGYYSDLAVFDIELDE